VAQEKRLPLCNIYVTLVTNILQGEDMKFHDLFLKLIDTEAKQKIVKFLLKHDAPMSEREIASLAGISHMTVNRILRDLEEWNLVYYQRVGRAHIWKINRKSYIYDVLNAIQKKIESIPEPIKELKEDILLCLPKKLLLKVILFGSIAEATEKVDSDIDLFILVKNEDDARVLEQAIDKLSAKCLEKFGNRLSVYVLTEKKFKQKKDLKVIKEISQGIQLFPGLKG